MFVSIVNALQSQLRCPVTFATFINVAKELDDRTSSICKIAVITELHLFPPNLGGSARILDKVHPISAVRQISQLS